MRMRMESIINTEQSPFDKVWRIGLDVDSAREILKFRNIWDQIWYVKYFVKYEMNIFKFCN
jgi:hypothetical protein